MTKTIKFWTGFGIAAMASASIAQAGGTARTPHASPLILAQAAGEAGESGGEGNGGEGEMSDVDFAVQIGYVDGHMTVGIELYKLGHVNAAVHMKHPADELYADLKPAFEARKAAGFAGELDALSTAVEAGKPVADVEALLVTLKAAIAANRGRDLTIKETLLAAVAMTRTAADEFAIGVVDGKIVNDKEYQDAWGFVQVARAMLAAKAEGAPDLEAKVVARAIAELDSLKPLWPDVTGAAGPGGESKALAVAAAKMELALYELK